MPVKNVHIITPRGLPKLSPAMVNAITDGKVPKKVANAYSLYAMPVIPDA